MDDKSIICSFESLYRAYKKAKAGKGFNGSCARFQTMSLEGVHTLKEQLVCGASLAGTNRRKYCSDKCSDKASKEKEASWKRKAREAERQEVSELLNAGAEELKRVTGKESGLTKRMLAAVTR